MTTVAAVDVGSNTVLLLVARVRDDGGLEALREEVRFCRLGKGVDRTGQLDPASIDRAIAALREYRAAMDELGVARVGAVGTQALREAANASAFLAPAADILGVDVEVVAGEREAELEYLSAARSFPALTRDGITVVDVGGGSTEIIIGRGDAVSFRRSLPIGAVRQAERHLARDPPTPAQLETLTADIDRALAEIDIPSGATVVGMAGTATTLAAVELAIDEFDMARIDGMRLSADAIERQIARYAAVTLDERKQFPGMPPERADVIIAGATIFARALRRANSDALVVSGQGVRWGVAYELASASS